MQESGTIVHDSQGERFHLENRPSDVYLKYELGDGVIDILSTYVTPELRNRGLGANLVETALEYAIENGLKVRPTCPFVPQFLENSPRYTSLRV